MKKTINPCLLSLTIIILFLTGCEKATLPKLNSIIVSNISGTLAISGGNITSDGDAPVIARGVCWSTNEGPTIANSKTSDGTGTGTFSSNITGLIEGTIYHVKAYATNSVGTAYGEDLLFSTLAKATLTTAAISDIRVSSAISGGNIINNGGSAVIERGVCWSTSHNPTTAENKTIDGTGIGSFTSSLIGLAENSIYYLRAYATNSVGTSYGNELNFKAYAVKDVDGNFYYSVTINTQIWMVENLQTTHYKNDADVPLITDNSDWKNLSTPGYCWNSNNEATNKNIYGALYNWYAVSTGNLCPSGWHVPSDGEWTTLTDYLGGLSVAGNKIKEAGSSHWAGTNKGTNETGFTALPAGARMDDGVFGGIGNSGVWWSSTESNSTCSWLRVLYFNNSTFVISGNVRTCGFSVRCVKD